MAGGIGGVLGAAGNAVAGALGGGGGAGGADGAAGGDFNSMLGQLKSMYDEAQKNNVELRKLTVAEGTEKKAAEAQVQSM
jgi:hypothetical protein